MNKKYDSKFSINKPWANIYKKESSDGENYFDGLYYCKEGVVECTSEIKRNMSYFRFTYNGVLYMRTIHKAYPQRGLAIMAGKFVKEIIASCKEKEVQL